jgi:rRNA maturation RNase YbeY
MPKVNLHFEEISRFYLQLNLLEDWLNKVCKKEMHELLGLNFVFCSDSYLLQMNQQYLNHDNYTDVITFDNSNESELIEGDIFISIDRVNENAKRYNVDDNHELHRVMVHGVLHLCGYGDKSSEDKKIMKQKEEAYLSLLKKQDVPRGT